MNNPPAAAKIAVAAATYWLDRDYDYLIPPSLTEKVVPGVRVTVPFGRGNRRTEGIVLSVGPAEDRGIELKNVASVLDREPALSKEMLHLAVWLRGRYFCPVYDVVHAMLPAGLWYQLESVYALCSGVDRETAYEAAGRSKQEILILDAVFAHGGSCPAEDLERLFDGASPSRALQSLIKKEILQTDSREKRRIGDKKIRMVSLAVPVPEARDLALKKERRAPMQSAVLRLLCTLERVSLSELCYFTGASSATVNTLEKSGVLTITQEEVFRRPGYSAGEEQSLPALNAEQQRAFEGLMALYDGEHPSASLLHGVTGSGKTTVYVHLIHEMLRRGRSSILLVPEIALTPQMIRIFSSYFGENIAVLHSSLAVGERYDEWKRIRSGQARVVIGTRSAVFAPCRDLGLIIIDEEQEYTYKSENSPRYHARDVAKYRVVSNNGMLLLGSATPDLESMYWAQQGKYRYFRLEKRFNEGLLPSVKIVDMRSELAEGNGSALSRRLIDEIRENIRRGEQSILFLNRRGTSSLIACGECGFTYTCPNCSVHLTWHGRNRRLMCHHCGYSRPMDDRCPECGGLLNHFGTGTQKLEDELREAFPDTEILRMDADSVSPAGSHEKILSRFREQKIPILLGTQMVAKGLDFENVTLVGVISADQSLYTGDYRASERCFSLITQVVGRSGRGERPGRAVIQTFTPNNQVIRLAAEQDYDAFYALEIELRRLQDCPPFSDIVTVTASGADESAVMRCCAYVRDVLQRELRDEDSCRVLGPAPLPVVRVNNLYRYHVTLHCEYSKRIRTLISSVLIQCNTAKEFKGVSVFADYNPME
ncbi:MAG: primosomal protein N' [Oscillospiraceae bacterium]|nr:primosomal protein N' [Oscillospiraceae bacterium]